MLLSQLCDKKDPYPVCFTQALPINAKCDLKVPLYTYKVVHMFALCSFCWAVSPSSVSLALPHPLARSRRRWWQIFFFMAFMNNTYM